MGPAAPKPVLDDVAEFQAQQLEVGARNAQSGEEEGGAVEVDGVVAQRLEHLVGGDGDGGGVLDGREGEVGLVDVLGFVEQAVVGPATRRGLALTSGEPDVLAARRFMHIVCSHE